MGTSFKWSTTNPDKLVREQQMRASLNFFDELQRNQDFVA